MIDSAVDQVGPAVSPTANLGLPVPRGQALGANGATPTESGEDFAAVYYQRLAGDVAGQRGGKKQRSAPHLLRRSPAFQGNVLERLGIAARMITRDAGHARFDIAWSDPVYTDIRRPCLGERHR